MSAPVHKETIHIEDIKEGLKKRTAAQGFGLIIGSVLVLMGLLGFLANASFPIGIELESGSFLGFEVNGWHNLIHLFSGLLLLSVCWNPTASRGMAIGFAVLYTVLTVAGLVDSSSNLLGLVPMNGFDNALHALLAFLAILSALYPSIDREGLEADHDSTPES
jgi:hypothetical protein